MVPADAVVLSAYDRQALNDHLQSGVAWLGYLGDLRSAVLAEDWALAKKIAARRITYPQPYGGEN